MNAYVTTELSRAWYEKVAQELYDEVWNKYEKRRQDQHKELSQKNTTVCEVPGLGTVEIINTGFVPRPSGLSPPVEDGEGSFKIFQE